MTHFRMLLALPVFCLATAAPARADLVITGTSAQVYSGGTGTVDFFLTSDGPTYNLASFNLQLQINRISAGSFLQFTTSQTDPYSLPNYVFSGNSFGQNNLPPGTFWSSPFTSFPTNPNGTPNDSISAGDSTNNGNNITVTPSNHFLLGEVQFQAAPGAAPGDSFQIVLVPSSSPPTSATTNFQDNSSTFLDYTSTPATVTVATPEPSSLLLAGMGSLTGLLHFWRSRRKNSGEVITT